MNTYLNALSRAVVAAVSAALAEAKQGLIQDFAKAKAKTASK